jgi:DNA-directed RNA polymerase subunit RPC12/RpoP
MLERDMAKAVDERIVSALKASKLTERCPSHPTAGETHECLANEMRCAYCGVRLAPYPCHSCGRFLTAKRMNETVTEGMPHMCTECVP